MASPNMGTLRALRSKVRTDTRPFEQLPYHGRGCGAGLSRNIGAICWMIGHYLDKLLHNTQTTLALTGLMATLAAAQRHREDFALVVFESL